jgi:hypothetical protein
VSPFAVIGGSTRELTAAQIEQFIRDGFVKVDAG